MANALKFQTLDKIVISLGLYYWKAKLITIVVILLQFILVFILYDFERTKYKEYVYPVIWDVLGWSIPLVIVLCIPLTAITKIIQLSSVDPHSTLKQVTITKRSFIVSYVWKPLATGSDSTVPTITDYDDNQTSSLFRSDYFYCFIFYILHGYLTEKYIYT